MTKLALGKAATFAKEGKLYAKNGHVLLEGDTVGRWTFNAGTKRFSFDSFVFRLDSFATELAKEPTDTDILTLLEANT